MAKAEVLIAAYVEAGYTKIHLDCSMSCADDPAVLDDEVVASRTARLMQVAEDAAHRGGTDGPMYVIGTEVPVPGGAHETLDRLTPTPADRARRTIAAHRAAFAELALQHVWPRVMALVVQPGVEFDHLHVIDYERSATVELRRVLDDEDHLVFEAHSTDYQRPAQLRELVEDHWAVLKVGPALDIRDARSAVRAGTDRGRAHTAALPVEPDRGRRTPDAGRARPLAGLLRRERLRSPSAPPGATATATGSATTGPTTRSTPRGGTCWRTSTARVSRCR